jgi:hypothetical protein
LQTPRIYHPRSKLQRITEFFLTGRFFSGMETMAHEHHTFKHSEHESVQDENGEDVREADENPIEEI